MSRASTSRIVPMASIVSATDANWFFRPVRTCQDWDRILPIREEETVDFEYEPCHTPWYDGMNMRRHDESDEDSSSGKG